MKIQEYVNESLDIPILGKTMNRNDPADRNRQKQDHQNSYYGKMRRALAITQLNNKSGETST